MTILDTMKAETQPWHDKVEELAASHHIMDGSFTYGDYSVLISRHYTLHNALEPRLADFLSTCPIDGINFAERRKLAYLQQDRQELHNDIQESHFEPQVTITTPAQALGCMYVLEGSSLGGSVIKRQLGKSPHFEGVHFHFFGCYGEDTGRLWKEFRAAVLNTIDTPKKENEIVQAAIATFSDVARCFTPGIREISSASA